MKKKKKTKRTYRSFWQKQAEAALSELGRPIPEKPPIGREKGIAAMPKEELTARRVAAGLTMTQLAGQLGITCATISRYESGERPITEEIAAEIRGLLTVHTNA